MSTNTEHGVTRPGARHGAALVSVLHAGTATLPPGPMNCGSRTETRGRDGAFVSELSRAFCFMGYERDAPVRVWRCSVSHDACSMLQERTVAANVLVDRCLRREGREVGSNAPLRKGHRIARCP